MTQIAGVEVRSVQRLTDERGFFTEIARVNDWPTSFVQMNHSYSDTNVLRGLHYHLKQADLWYVVRGTAQVALVDLRVDSGPPTVELLTIDGREPRAIYIPPGVAHGYLALSPVDLVYWVTEYYDDTDEHGVAWDDASLGIAWAVTEPILSERDRSNPPLDG